MAQRIATLAPEFVAPPTVPAVQTPLEYVLTEALAQARLGGPDISPDHPLRVTVTNLCHAVYRAHTENDGLPGPRVLELTRAITRAGGGFA